MRLRKETDTITPEDIEFVAAVSDSLAHPARVQILRYIMKQNSLRERVCNKDLVNAFEYSQATISQHVKKLSASGLVQSKKQDKYSTYFVNIGILSRYVDLVRKFE